MLKKIVSTLCLLAGLPMVSAQAAYPDHAVSIVLSITPGGAPDSAARYLAQSLNQRFGTSFVVENKPGAGGTIGMGHVAKAAPDGYTVALLTSTELVVSPHLYRNLPVRALRDLEPVASLAAVTTVLVVPASAPYSTLDELIAYAKKNPGKLNFGSSGNGSVHHLAGVLLSRLAGIEIQHIPYKGSAQVVPALMGGDLQLSFVGIPLAKSLIEQGKLRALGMSGESRVEALPDVPTLDELGLKGFDVTSRYGIFAPKQTPEEVKTTLGKALSEILNGNDTKAYFSKLGMDVYNVPLDTFQRTLLSDDKRFEELVKSSGMVVN